MEIFDVTLLSFFVIFVSFVIHFHIFKSKSGSSGCLPPGKTGWPVIGETLVLLSSGWKGHPEKFVLDRMAKYSSNVFRTHLFGQKAAVFCGAAGNKILFSNENKLVRAWWPKSVHKIFPTQNSPNEEAIRLRRMLPEFLKPEALQRYIGVMDHITRRHFSLGWENKDQVLVFPLCKNYTLQLACRVFLSVEDPIEVDKLLKPYNVFAAGLFSVPINFPGTPFNRAIKAGNEIRKILLAIIKQRKIDLADGKALPTQDILSNMLSVSGENGNLFNDSDVADKILGLLSAGHDTASSTCTLIVYYLAEFPEIYEGVYNEQLKIANSKAPGELLNWEDIQKMKYSWNVACEVLRLGPPLQGAFREAITDFMFDGFSIPKGWKLYWNANSVHRNSEYFPEPLKFDPTRFDGSGPAPYTYIPFGGGPRMCPGKEYARLEILVFMHNLVTRFKLQKIIPDEKIVVVPMPKPDKDLPIRLFPHKA